MDAMLFGKQALVYVEEVGRSKPSVYFRIFEEGVWESNPDSRYFARFKEFIQRFYFGP